MLLMQNKITVETAHRPVRSHVLVSGGQRLVLLPHPWLCSSSCLLGEWRVLLLLGLGLCASLGDCQAAESIRGQAVSSLGTVTQPPLLGDSSDNVKVKKLGDQ